MKTYTRRTYRDWPAPAGYRRLDLRAGQTDMRVLCDCRPSRDAMEALEKARAEIEAEILAEPAFFASMAPLAAGGRAGRAARRMYECGEAWGVGPMAAVSGAIADEVALRILEAGAGAVIVENGGDVYAKLPGLLRFAVYAGEDSPFRTCPVLEIDASGGVGICTSSATVGPSLSLGGADAVTAVSGSAADADAAATAIGNLVCGAGDVERVVEEERAKGRLRGLYACAGEKAAFWGRIRLVGFLEGRVER
ncbi:UPF0280 family protein [Candidatus Fermentibacteria bacterium]|nr:UPF0280 family protein [Candidatus Fermentibacteria bacterium]